MDTWHQMRLWLLHRKSFFRVQWPMHLTHTGQIAMLRRMAGCPMRGENYYRAEIVAGRVGPDQAAPVRDSDGA